jgi:hypothetical protein
MKIVETYPEVDLYWLLNGKGSFPKEKASVPPAPTASQPTASQPTATTIPQDLFSSGEERKEIKRPMHTDTIENRISFTGDMERIVVFYNNGTFKNYVPE